MATLYNFGKWTGKVPLALLLILSAAYLFIRDSVNARLAKRYSFAVEQVAISPDSLTLAWGEHLAQIKSCIECHGDKLAGKVLVDDVPMGRLSSSNLTRGQGGQPPG